MEQPIKLLLAGNAVTARILAEYIKADKRYEIIACVVDDEFVSATQIPQYESIGISQIAAKVPAHSCRVLMAGGYGQINSIRKSLFERLAAMGYDMETYIHPQAMLHCQAPVGAGSVLLPGSLVEPGARVGKNCFIWGNVVVAHDAVIGDHCWLAAGAVVSGMAEVGECCFVGVNATIANKVTIGANSIIGGAAFISRNIKPESVMLARSAEPFRATASEYAKYFGM